MEVPCLILMVLCSSLTLDHVRERDKALLRSILVGECLEWVSSREGTLSGCAL